MIEVTVLGSGTCVPQADRSSPATLVRVAGDLVLVDGGTGTVRRLLEAGVHYADIDYLFYTHVHPDHVMDLVPFLFATKHTPGLKRRTPLRVLGPRGFKTFFGKLMDVFGQWVLSDDYVLELEEVDESTLSFGRWTVSTFELEHSLPCVGYRFAEGDAVVAVAGDTGYCRGAVELARGAGLLVIECSFPDEIEVEGHLTPRLVSQIGRESRCMRLLLTHMYPVESPERLAAACRSEYAGEVIAGRDLLVVTV